MQSGIVKPYNPLETVNLARSIGSALEGAEAVALGALEPFCGGGVYALYYAGSFYAYAPLAKANRGRPSVPIYVGKADAPGRRKGLGEEKPADRLFKRMQDHVKSIEYAENLEVEDFSCRYLVVDALWVSLGESLLISKYCPVWNVEVDGFGNHAPGAGRRNAARPLWDTLHPGRPWAAHMQPNDRTAEEIGRSASAYLAERIEA